MDLIINFFQDLKGYPDSDISKMAKMYDLEAPVNDLRWMIAIKHSTSSASMLSGGIMLLAESLPAMQKAAEERNDQSFPQIDKEYVERLYQLVNDQKQLKGLNVEQKKKKGMELGKREGVLKKEPGWGLIQELMKKIPTKQFRWTVHSYIDGTTNKIEDIQSRLIPAISDFEWLKKQSKIDKKTTLQKLEGLRGLEELLDRYESELAERRGLVTEKEETRAEGKLIYDGKDIKIIQPLTEAASCYYGQGTKWCTAATQAENLFEVYHKRGPLYIVQPKNPKRGGKEKYQLHFETNSFTDEKDEEIDLAGLFKEYPELSALRKHTDSIPATLLSEADLSTIEHYVDKEGLSNKEASKLLLLKTDDYDILKYLIDNYTVNLETKGGNKDTPLVRAAWEGDAKVLNLLLEHGADIEAKDDEGRTALIYVAENGHVKALKLLLENEANIEAKNKDGETALVKAAANGKNEALKLLLEHGADPKVVLPYYMSLGDKTDFLKLLLEYGADPNAKNKNGDTALIRAASRGNTKFLNLLLEYEANTEIKDKYGKTALMWAAGWGDIKVLKLLLEKKADIEAKDKDEETALMKAAQNGQNEALKLLLEYGADLETKSPRFGYTALAYAAIYHKRESVKLLLESGAKVSPEIRRLFPDL